MTARDQPRLRLINAIKTIRAGKPTSSWDNGVYNEFMSTRGAEYLEAIEHLPAGAILVFPEIPWEE
jgi:hypothetical protein